MSKVDENSLVLKSADVGTLKLQLHRRLSPNKVV